MESDNLKSNPKSSFVAQAKDLLLLLGAATAICIAGVASFWLADMFHVNELWVFFAAISIAMVPIIGRGFRSQFKKPTFILFFLVWMTVHSLLVVGLLYRVRLIYWPFILWLELYAGYCIALWLFDATPDSK